MEALKGVTVVDMTKYAAGPFCTMLLADFGADIIKVEGPKDPCPTRHFFPRVDDGDMSGYFAQYNRHKRDISVDLRSDEGKEIIKELVKKADILVENFRPGVMDKLGLGYDVLKQLNPRLVYCAISGFGQSGPYSRRPAFDNNAQALSGIWSINGYPDRPPVRVGTIIGDLSASLYAAYGIMLALRYAEKTGKGQMVDIAQTDCVISLMETAFTDYSLTGKIQTPLGNDNPNVRPYGQFKAKDGYVFFGGYLDSQWPKVCEFFGEPEFAKQPGIDTMTGRFDPDKYNNIVKPKLESWLAQYTVAELEAGLAEKIPLAGIKNIKQVVEDPQVQARQALVTQHYPEKDVLSIGQAVKLSETPGDPVGLSPHLGQHTDEVLKQFLGYDDAKLEALKRSGAISG